MMNWKCNDCSWTGTNDELRLKTYPNGGDDTLCPNCGGVVEEIETDNAMIKEALIESKKLLEYYIDYEDGLNNDHAEVIESIKHFLQALKTECHCDDYNGFNCGCSRRSFLCDEALKELELITTNPSRQWTKIN